MRFDFPTVMVLLVVASGLIWALDVLVLARRRRSAVPEVGGEADGEQDWEPKPVPKIVEYARSFFPVFLIVLLLRSFLVEPFRIPSGSMMPTLLVGDFILVNKFVYGIRLPVLDDKIFDVSQPQRGDVVVFRYPKDPSIPFIKRVVGLPGDRIAYYNKVLYINGQQADQRPIGTYTGKGAGTGMTGASLRQETLGSITHPILVQNGYPTVDGELVIPEGQYFVLGDNRDNSRDSRYWGTVPEKLLIGKAFTIWMNWDFGNGIDWQRIGTSIE
ncbi:MAG: signal peptidase I [Gammaproteobacteria bacterium]|nr:MAG: signal peptidase I [Gammaproteobacteria bacterium]